MHLRWSVVAAASCFLAVAAVTGFDPPDAQRRLQAIGPVADLPPELQRAFSPDDDFEPIQRPGPHDWLANHRESGQTFIEYQRSRHRAPDPQQRSIYLQPLGDLDTADGPSINHLCAFTAAFFTLEVKLLPALDIATADLRTRANPYSGHRQLRTGDILSLLRQRLPDDALCVVGVTLEDLYPDESWNFVFGQASLRDRVGVYSFARYLPSFWGETVNHPEQLVLRRSCKVLVHETGHILGIHHCVYFNCVMSGSNHLEESDRRPLHLCPVDLRKLHLRIGFDVADRCQRLAEVCRQLGFEDEAHWYSRRLSRLKAQ